MNQQNSSDSLSTEKLQLFMAGLSGLPMEEIRKAKILYLRNAVCEYHAAQSSMASFRVAQGCVAFIPVFWPILYVQTRMMKAEETLMRERIQNAIDVWRDDLKGEAFVIDGETIRV